MYGVRAPWPAMGKLTRDRKQGEEKSMAWA
jgi:hypothetical protein